MKKFLTICLSLIVWLGANAQTHFEKAKQAGSASMTVHYLDNYPFAYQNESGQLTGIEVEVLMAYADWLLRVKEIKLSIEFVPYNDFAKVYEQVKGSKEGNIGLASATITKERQKEVLFTPPYLKNVSLLVSNIDVPTLRAYSDFPEFFKDMTALVMRGTVMEAHLIDVQKKHHPKMRVNYVEHPKEVVQQIALTNNQYFGYVDILTYWAMLKEAPANVKIHRVANIENQRFGLMLPLGSSWERSWAEFMEGGFGFAATETYYNILTRHLGYEVLETVSMP